MWWGAAVRSSLSPPWLLASQRAYIPIKSKPLKLLCLFQQARMLPKPTCVDPFSFTHAYQRHLDVPSWCLFSSLSYLVTWRSFLQLWLYRRSSAHFQLVFCENYSTCRCIFDAFCWWRWVSHPTPPSWSPLRKYFWVYYKYSVSYCVRLIYFSYLYIIEKLFFCMYSSIPVLFKNCFIYSIISHWAPTVWLTGS